MSDNIISYIEMFRREGLSLQQGMNFGVGGTHSVVLMSLRPNAPYKDRVEDGGTTLIYEGHDVPRTAGSNPKLSINPSDIPPDNSPRMANFITLPSWQRLVRIQRNESACMKKCGLEFGLTTVFFTWSIPGGSEKKIDTFSSFDWRQLKATKISRSRVRVAS